MPNLEKEAAQFQAELFELLAEFFGRAIGILPTDFATIDNFSAELSSRASALAYRAEDAIRWADTELRQFYSKKGPTLFRLAARLGGLKLVLGGSSRFLGTHFRAVSGSLLYADTILIPDPILPWLERERWDEKFPYPSMLHAAHALLHLKPIVDADLPHCPILVFPSFEKLLDAHDTQTQEGVLRLLMDVLALYVDPEIASTSDLERYVQKNETEFLQSIERNDLFVAQGGRIGEPLVDALSRYEREIKIWRSPDRIEEFERLSIPGKIVNALFERLTPQYHLYENAEELGAHPLICIEQQAHYFKLVSKVNSGRLEKIGLLDRETKATLTALGSERLTWLSDLPIEALVELRQNNENEAFRKCLSSAVGRLHESAIGDTDKVSAEICREIDSGIAEHNRLIKQIEQKYGDRRVELAAVAAGAGLGALVPSLAPYLGTVLPLALAGKLGLDKWNQSVEKRRQSKSLMGVLATIRSLND